MPAPFQSPQNNEDIVLCMGSNGELQAVKYVREGSTRSPSPAGIGGHVDEPATTPAIKFRDLIVER